MRNWAIKLAGFAIAGLIGAVTAVWVTSIKLKGTRSLDQDVSDRNAPPPRTYQGPWRDTAHKWPPTEVSRDSVPNDEKIAVANSTNDTTQIANHEFKAEEQATFYAQALADETRDPDWSLTAEQSIIASVEGLQSNTLHIDDLRCGRTLCKVILVADDSNELQTNLQSIFSIVSWDHQGFVFVDPLDNRRAEIYAARGNMKLPTNSTQ